MTRRLVSLLGFGAFLAPITASALYDRSMVVQTGVRISIEQLFANVYGFAAASVVSITSVLFLIGASYLVASHGDSNMVDKGKKIMIGSLIGMGIVLGAYGILRTLFAIIY
jgi:hypothetical protein